MSPECTTFLMHRAQCYQDQGQSEESIKDLTNCQGLDGNNPQVLYQLGLSFYADG